MKFKLVLLFVLYAAHQAAAQLSASFVGPASACLQQNIILTNNSTGASRYEWDFSPHDTDSLLSDQNIAALPGLSGGYGFKIVEENGTWFGFVISQLNHSIYRLDFGNSPLNTPTVVGLGNPGGILDYPTSIELYKSGNNWYGFVGLFNPNAGIARLDFGSSLTNTPSAQNLGMFGQSGRFWDVKVVEENNNLTLVLPLRNGTSSVIVVNYRNSFNNSISNANDVYSSGPISTLGIATSLDVVKSGSDWVALVSSNSNNSLVQLRFTATILAAPIEENTYSISLNKPLNVRMLQEGSRFVAVIANENTNVKVVDFFDLNPSTTPSPISHSSLSSLLGIGACRYKGNSILYGVGFGNQVRSMIFKSYTDAPLSYTETTTPNTYSYSLAGIKDIELSAFDSQDLFSTIGLQINVSSSISPDINFSSQNNCINNNVNFTSANLSGNISTYQWDFGDGGTTSSVNPNYSFTSASTYAVSLNVTANNGCQNDVQKSLQTFNPPQSNFSLPVASPLCTNQNYLFTNTSTSDPGSNPTWQWSVNGSNVSTVQDLNYLFASSSSQSISLTASIPGCSTQSTQNINNLTNGPLVSFNSPSASCVGTSVSFINTTSGSVINTSWTYGDGNSSSQTNGSNAFSNAGNYLVTLSSSNAAGCQNSSSQNITIYSVPQPDFAIEAPPLSCANSPSQFDNLTPPLVDSNISSWSWKFGDALNGSSKIKNPTYTYSSANNYTVALVATTNVGCTDSIKKTITIFPLPQAGFTNLPACINQGTQFNDASTGSISFYQWSVQNSILQGKTPLPYTFKSSGGFPVTLTVTGNNGCLNQITKTINVPLKPIIDFTLQAPCTGHPTSFQELNTGGADPAIAWNWNFEQGSGTGSPVSYQFPSEGGYTVTMNTTRQSGCVYSTSKNISISAGPVANFTPSIFAGAAPLDVIFNNTSTAETYLWQFDDANQTTSTNDSPEFIYTQLGKYKVLLSAYNSLGCSDTLSTEIDVVVPHIDIAMNNFLLTSDPSSNSSKAVVTILNSGNIPLVDPEIFIDFGGNASVKEKISGLIRPGKSLVQTLGLQIVPRSLQYICAEIDAVDDINSTNNKRCISLSNEDVIMTPYPNPSTDGEITLEWVGAQEDVTITIFRTNGEIAFAKNLDAISAGLGQLTINTSVFSNGLYLIQFTGNKATKAFRIMIAN